VYISTFSYTGLTSPTVHYRYTHYLCSISKFAQVCQFAGSRMVCPKRTTRRKLFMTLFKQGSKRAMLDDDAKTCYRLCQFHKRVLGSCICEPQTFCWRLLTPKISNQFHDLMDPCNLVAITIEVFTHAFLYSLFSIWLSPATKALPLEMSLWSG